MFEKGPEAVDLTVEEAEQLKNRLKSCNLIEQDKKLLLGLIHLSSWLQIRLLDAKLTIRKLYQVFNITSEKRGKVQKPKDKDEESPETAANDDAVGEKENEANEDKLLPKKSKNNGRIPAKAYTGAKKIFIKHPCLSHGDPCLEPLCSGRVYNTPPGNVLRITSGSLADAKHYEIQNLRCYLCAALYPASLPEEVGPDKYDARFKATLAVHKYYLGVPFHRLERFQSYLGVPLPDSTQWDLVEQAADCVYPVFYHLEHLAAQGKAMFIDDTKTKILEVMKAFKENPSMKRKGCFTTGIISQCNDYDIYLFYASKNHAGENALKLLQQRDLHLDKILYMCDALAANMPDKLVAIILNCLCHARRNFVQIEAFFPEECKTVIEALAKVYKHDAEAKAGNLSPQTRLEYHQEHSGPVMKKLKIWLNQQLDDRLVEPNSNLGKAIQYMLKHWPELTKFLHVVGAALDNNKVEQALKLPIRSRKTAMFFATSHGAFVGSILLSLIVTCNEAGENPIDYLTALQENKTQIFKEPHNWLPWTYKAKLNQELPKAA